MPLAPTRGSLEREDIQQALGYAAWAMEERVVPRETTAGK
jgi:hypothetical protein